jgi:hypothetical protein
MRASISKTSSPCPAPPQRSPAAPGSAPTSRSLLLLPPYVSDEQMRERISLAISEGAEAFHLR